MSWCDWWEVVKELLQKPKEHQEEPKRRFLPPHSLPDSELPPKWPPKDERK